MIIDEIKGVIANKIPLERYRELLANNQTVNEEIYSISDIDKYVHTYKESLDTNNPIILRNLETGFYKIYGYFRYYSSQSGISAVDPFAFIIIEKGSTYSYATIVSSNEVKRYKITNSSYEDLEDSGWIALNSYISYRKIRNVVYLKGSVTTTNATGTMPSGYRPLNNHVFLIAGSGTYYAKARVTNAGVVSILGGTGTSTTTYEFVTSYPIN